MFVSEKTGFMSDRIQKSIKYFADEQLRLEVKKYQEVGKKAMVKLHHDIIDDWFGEYSSESMKDTINLHTVSYKTRLYESNDGTPTGRITFNAYIDSKYYNQNQEIQNWNNRNSIGLSHDVAVEYVMSLQLFEGIIGLPKDGTRELPKGTIIHGSGHINENRRWENDNFIQQTPLLKFIKNAGRWSAWESVVNSFL